MKDALNFLKEDVYLPGYTTIENFKYDKNRGLFEFNPVEFLVSPIEKIDYLTPRGLHLCLSQASYALGEEILNKELGGDVSEVRKSLLEGRVKIIELNQKLRKEIKTGEPLFGEVTLRASRRGKTPIYSWEFDFGDKSIYGNMVTIIAQDQMIQTNASLSRLNLDR
ncbi:MAG: hypothetical protein PF542_01800 [Nanoarchaeota archaeon]|jgi:hypothetical protein|nr:hypothetical protein [Nanoarchaeota archaeon]